MKRALYGLVLILTVTLQSSGGGIEGEWRTIDDVTGKTKSIVQIVQTPDGEYEGTVIEILHSDRGPNPLCDDCKGERKGQPIKGLVILWGLKEKRKEHYKGGEILDPKNGKIYKAKLKLREDGDLEVRGFIGFSLLGRTQLWKRNES
jgi:uncharacterized protein (DUF2147 family)